MGKSESQGEREMEVAAMGAGPDGRVEVEAGDDEAECLRDEAAAKLRAMGWSAADAACAVDAVQAVLAQADRRMCESVAGPAFGRVEAMESLRLMALKLVNAPRPRFSTGCFLLAAGMNWKGAMSYREWAAQQKVSPELASNEVSDWQQWLGLPKTSAQKSEAARSRYADTNGAKRRL